MTDRYPVFSQVDQNLSLFANYSWQGTPQILADANPYPTAELAYPPTNRFNAGFSVDCGHVLGNLSVNYSDKAFWSDVLSSPYHGYSDAYTMLNGSFGWKWAGGRIPSSRFRW